MSELMTVSETARALNRCSETIRHWADRGLLPVVRTAGGIRLFRREDVDRARESQEIERRLMGRG